MEIIKNVIPIRSIKGANLNEALKIFNSYKEKGVIQVSNFDYKKWVISDEYHSVTLNFDINKKEFQDNYDFLEMDSEQFIVYLKIFILYKFGELAIESLRDVLRIIIKTFGMSPDDIGDMTNKDYKTYFMNISDFLDFLNENSDNKKDEMSFIKEQLEIAANNLLSENERNQRILLSYDSYLTLGEIIERFWKECTDKKEKLFFFPIWFWWTVSGSMPMRPKEIILTPEDCLREVNGEWLLTIRKSAVKGNNKKKYYNIDEDNFKYSFIIPNDVAKTINWYIQNTKEYRPNELNTLFMPLTHTYKKNWGKKTYLTYENMCVTLNLFYEKIVCGEYCYRLINDIYRKYLDKMEIQKVRLGDTRHLSAINAILEGAAPTAVKVLLGDRNDNIAAHYYSNATRYVECRTYRASKKMLKGKKSFDITAYNKPPAFTDYIEIENGWCYSPKTIGGVFDDCQNAVGPSGQIGFCPKCHFYRSQNKTFEQSAAIYKSAIEDDIKGLKRMVDAYRNSKGNPDDVLRALQQLRSSENDYAKYLFETKGDKEWEDIEKQMKLESLS